MITIRGKDYRFQDWWIVKKVLEKGLEELHKSCHRQCESCSSQRACHDLDRIIDYTSFQLHEDKQ